MLSVADGSREACLQSARRVARVEAKLVPVIVVRLMRVFSSMPC